MTMKFDFKSKFVIVLSLFVLFLSISGVSALDNITDVQDDIGALENNDIDNVYDAQIEHVVEIKNTSINSNSPSVYYKEKGQLVTYLKDDCGQPISNKNLTILLNGKIYTKTTDKTGKAVLDLNLKPNKYDVKIKFDGDENYSSSDYDAVVKVLKTPLSIKCNNFNTYWKSDLFFKTKVFNKAITKSGDSISSSRYAPPKKPPDDVLNTNHKTDKPHSTTNGTNIIKNSFNLFILSPPWIHCSTLPLASSISEVSALPRRQKRRITYLAQRNLLFH